MLSPSAPALLSISVLLQQWADLYNRGKKFGIATGVLSAGSYIFLASSLPAKAAALYGAAGLCISIVPFTLLVMKGTNDQLFKENERLQKNENDVKNLLVKWGMLNSARGLFPMAGFILGISALAI
jgi:hypothetical protein